MFNLIRDFTPENDNQIDAKKLIIKEIIEYENNYEHTRNRIPCKYKRLNSDDTYSYIEGSKNNKFILFPFKYQEITEENNIEQPKITPHAISQSIFDKILKPNGWIKETNDTHNSYIKNEKTYKPIEVIPILIDIFSKDKDLLKHTPKSSKFRKYFNPTYKPSDNKWKPCTGYYEFFLQENIEVKYQQDILTSIRQIRNNPNSIQQKGYNEINIDKYHYFIILDRENYKPPTDNEEIMLNNNTQKIEYVNKENITEKNCNKCNLFYLICTVCTFCSFCEDCMRIVNYNRCNDNFRGKFLAMYNDIKNDKRFKYLEEEPIISFEEFCLQFIIQGGVSYYTGKSFIYETNNPRNISRERIDNKKGYIKNNVCFIERILNISPRQNECSDWSLDKIIKFKEELHEEKDIKFDLDNFNEMKFKALTNKQGVQPGILTQEQQDIKNQLSNEDWKKHYHNEYKKKYRKTDLKGFLNSRISAHKRFDKEKFEIEGNIDFEFILNLIKEVECKCAISNKIMNLNSEMNDFNLSIERIDNKKPHNKDNVILVCKEFNVWGDLHWNKQLFNELFI